MSQKIKTSVEIDGSLKASQIANATTDTDKFLVSDDGTIKYRTSAEILSDLGITLNTASKLQHQVKAGVAINKGQAVYVTSADGTNMIVGLASNASEATSSKTMGLLNATVVANGFADVVTEGLLDGLDTSTATVGNPVWLGTGGNLIYGLANKPYAPNHLVFIGIVTRVNANNGEIFVKVQNGFELDEIHDVDLKTTTKLNGHLLGYNGSLWVNKTIAEWLGYTPYNASNPAGYISSYTETDPIYTASTWYSTTNNSSNWDTAFGWGNHALAGYVPSARTITINGTSYDLSANRSWTITASETDTLSTVAARGNIANYNIALGTNASISGGGSAKWITTDGTVFYGGGLVSSVNGSAKAYYYFDGTNAVVQGAAGIGIAFQPNNSTQATLNTSGDFTANASLRSPIFYDSNNTGYYLDPASTSNLNTVNSVTLTASGISYASGTGGFASSTYAVGVRNPIWRFGNADTYGLSYFQSTAGIGGLDTIGFHFGTATASGSQFQFRSDGYAYASGYLEGGASLRAPIFYDSQNTGYYVDPSSTSNLNGLTVSSTIAGSVNGASRYFPTNYVGGVQTNPQVYFNYLQGLNVAMTGAWSTWSDTLWINGYSGGDVPNMCALHFLRNGQPRMSISTQTRESTSYGTYYEVLTDYNYSSRSNFSGAVYGTIFYDSNNTGYYCDPASTSNMNSISAGGYIYANNYIESGGAIYGTIFYDNNNRSYYCDPHSTSFFAGLQANSNIQSPIYYDYNNTGYYVDPASTSNLNTLTTAGTTSAAGLGVLNTSSTSGYGLSLYNGAASNQPQYGIMFAGTATFGTFGSVTADWATYFTMDSTANRGWIFRDTANGNKASISNAGVATFAGDVVAYGSSDKQLKNNITPIENALQKVKQIGGYTFDWNDKQDVYTGHDVGVIAQEIEEVLPEVVTTRDNGYKAVKYEKIVPLLIEAIKEQQTQIEELKQLVQQLTQK